MAFQQHVNAVNGIVIEPPYNFSINANTLPNLHVAAVAASSLHGFSLIYFITAIYINNGEAAKKTFHRETLQSNQYTPEMFEGIKLSTEHAPFSIDPRTGKIFTTNHIDAFRKKRNLIFRLDVLVRDSSFQERHQIYEIKVFGSSDIFKGSKYRSRRETKTKTMHPPGPPQNIKFLSVSNSKISFSWEAPNFNGNSPITNYTISYTGASVNIITKELQADLTNLDFETRYVVCVVANNRYFFAKTQNVSTCHGIKDFTFTKQECDFSIDVDKSKVIDELSKAEICEENQQQRDCISVSDVAEKLNESLSSKSFYGVEDFLNTQTIIDKITHGLDSNNLTINEKKQVSRNVINTIDSLATKPNTAVGKHSKLKRSKNKIIKSLDLISQILSRKLADSENITSITLEGKSLSLIAKKVNKTDIQVLVRNENSSRDFPILIEPLVNNTFNYPVKVEIPSETFSNLTKNESNVETVISCILHKSSALFPTSVPSTKNSHEKLKNVSVQSYILAINIGDNKIKNLKKPIHFTFEKVKNFTHDGKSEISFWDVDKNKYYGRWSTDGISTLEDSGKYVSGTTNHLTNFALLLNIAQVNYNPIELQYVTWIGVGISIACLTFALITFILFRHLVKSLPNKLLLSLCTSLLLLLMTFVIGAERVSNKLECQLIAGMLHYFLLTTFFWMLAEACTLYLSIVRVFRTFSVKKFFIKFAMLSWGLPLVIVACCIWLRPDDYMATHIQACIVFGTTFYVGVLVPILCILTFNVVVLVIVSKKLREKEKAKRQRKSIENGKENHDHFITLRLAFSCNLLMGTSWMFAVLAVSEATEAIQWCFCVTNSLQGFFIFVMYILRNAAIRKAWYDGLQNVPFVSYIFLKLQNEKPHSLSTTTLTVLSQSDQKLYK